MHVHNSVSKRTAIARVLLLACITVPSIANADGKYFVRATEATPTIPHQRAIISFRDGIETLIVESTVNTAATDLGWVIPLPSEPTGISACTPGTLASTFNLIQPKVVPHDIQRTRGALTLFGFVVLCCCLIIANHLRGRTVLAPRQMLALGIAGAAIVFVSLPSLDAGRRGLARSGVSLLQSHQIGVYDLQVITGSSDSAVVAWLTDRKFDIPDSARSIIADYLANGWCFAVAQVRKDASSQASTHPVKFTFETKQPVYPLRLTALGNSEMQLDLYVIADKAAYATHLKRLSGDRYAPSVPSQRAWHRLQEDRTGLVTFVGTKYTASEVNLAIGHPEVTALMWPECTLTHLRGQLTPQQMKTDAQLKFSEQQPIRTSVYTRTAARALAVKFSGSAFILILVLGTLACKRLPPGNIGPLRTWVVAGFAIGAAAGLIGYQLLPTTDASVVSSRRQLGIYVLASGYATSLQEKFPDGTAVDFQAQWREIVREATGSSAARSQKFQPPQGDVPFGYEIAETDNGWNLTLYDEFATPAVFAIARTPESQ